MDSESSTKGNCNAKLPGYLFRNGIFRRPGNGAGNSDPRRAGDLVDESYAGGVSPDISDRSSFLAIYAFLRQALLAIPEERPFRGPPQFEQGNLRYENISGGDISCFHGTERIYQAGMQVYGLRYSGGTIR